MKEELLHFIWKYKLFYTGQLFTTNKVQIQINHIGELNVNAGPDFFNAKIRLDEQLWAGNVEIHLKSSDWYAHHHEEDSNYNNVILHVVWEEDVAVFDVNNRKLPTLELKKYVSKQLLENYHALFALGEKWILCEKEISTVPSFTMEHWIERLYFERLELKSAEILELLERSKYNWEAVLFQLLSKNFGLKVNGEAFFKMASSIDFTIVKKERQQVRRLESLFFGQLGMLDKAYEKPYVQSLIDEYHYQSKKYKLDAMKFGMAQYFRLRPVNFPTIRISQLANLYVTYQNLFSRVMSINSIEYFYDFFEIKASEFWDTHYTFEKESKKRTKKISKSFVDLLLINTIFPLKFVYLRHIGKLDVAEFLQLVKGLKAESNTVIEKFKELQIDAPSAFETQALLQLKNSYCKQQRCLKCAVGNELLKRKR